MAVPFARAALMKYVTDLVVETVAKQLQQRAAATQDAAALQAAGPDAAQLVARLNASILQLQHELAALEERMDRVDKRMSRLEKRWNWQAMVRVVLAVVVAFILGFAMYHLFRLGGWIR